MMAKLLDSKLVKVKKARVQIKRFQFRLQYIKQHNTDSLLRISSEKITPDEISKILDISPTEVRTKEELK